MSRILWLRTTVLTAIVCQACLFSLGCSAQSASDRSSETGSNSNHAATSEVQWAGVDSGYRSDGKK